MPLTIENLYASDGSADPSLMHVTAPRIIGATTINVDTLAGIPDDFIASSGPLLPSGFIDIANITNFYGHVDGSNLEIDGFLPGTPDVGNSTADVVVIKPNTWAQNYLIDLLKAFPGANLVDLSVIEAKIAAGAITRLKMGSITTKLVTGRAFNNLTSGAVTSVTTTLRVGSATNGTYSADGTTDLTSLSIPSGFYLLSAEAWVGATGNTVPCGTIAAAITALTNTSMSFSCQMTGNDAGFPSHNNSSINFRIRYL